MIASFDKEMLFSLLKDFYTVIGIRISVFDDEFNNVAEYPVDPPEICALIRLQARGLNACKECDRAAFERAKKLKTPHSYVCHAGITEAISPILFEGTVIGYAIFAHLMSEDNYIETTKAIADYCAGIGIEPAEAACAVQKLKTLGADKIAASMRILDAVTSYLQVKKMASLKGEDIIAQVKAYIDKNLGDKLRCDDICKKFFISRTQLYVLCEKAFGFGVSKYILSRRIEKSKELLTSGCSVSSAARLVGIDDYNYFCKLFKRETGTQPSKYRKAT